MRVARLITLCSLLLGGCSWNPMRLGDNEATVGSLRNSVKPVAAPTIAVQDPRAAAMDYYSQYLAATESKDQQDPLAPEAMRRLADLHLDNEQDQVSLGAAPEQAQSRAAELYRELLTRYPGHQHAEGALYQMARALDQYGDSEPAMQALSHYAEQHPGKPHYAEVQFRRGEYLFIHKDYHAAGQAYQSVLEQGQGTDLYRQALYKLGWSHFKLHDYTHGLQAFTQLLDLAIPEHASAELPTDLSRGEEERVLDTLRVVSLSFAYLGDAEVVSDYFSRQGARDYEPLIYASLAGMYLTKERFSDAAATYRQFARQHAQHIEAPLFQSRVIDVYKQAGFHQRVLEEKIAFVNQYQPAAKYWQVQGREKSRPVLDQVKRHLRDITQHYHAAAQQQKTPRSYTAAGNWYQLFLEAFKADAQAPTMHFLYAELLTEAGRHDQAAAAYEATAYRYGSHAKSAEAGYLALHSYTRHEQQLQGTQRASWHRQGIASSLKFSEQFPDHVQAVKVRLRATQQLFALQDYNATLLAAEPLIGNPGIDQSTRAAAWKVTAHSRFALADYERAEQAYLQALPLHRDSRETYRKLETNLAASVYQQAVAAREAGLKKEAVAHFLRIAQLAPASDININAQYDAGALLIELQDWVQAAQVLQAWRDANPTHELRLEVDRKLAVVFSEAGDTGQAAQAFAQLAQQETDPVLRQDAAWQAAEFYQKSGDRNAAIQAYKHYAHTYDQPVDQSMEACQQLVALYGEQQVYDKQRFWQRKLIAVDAAAGAQRSDRTRYLAANAQLALTQADFAAYQAVQLVEPLQQQLKRKKALMQSAIKGYDKAADYAVQQVTTEATYRLASLYQDFGQALLDSQRPSDLTDEALMQYDLLLEEQAYPFEEKAIEVFEANATRTAQGIYDEWIKQSLAQLAILMPARYAKHERSEAYVVAQQ